MAIEPVTAIFMSALGVGDGITAGSAYRSVVGHVPDRSGTGQPEVTCGSPPGKVRRPARSAAPGARGAPAAAVDRRQPARVREDAPWNAERAAPDAAA
ncbi:hypothetical protein C6361_35020 [Plantactinospora sp. BC1]|nr:hypothetical protein C6361_35020 [Plantactinospora sp. BC1]